MKISDFKITVKNISLMHLCPTFGSVGYLEGRGS